MSPDPHVARLRAEARHLSDAQRAALANELLLAITDAGCRDAVNRIARNAVTVAQALDRAAFVERDARRRVVS